MAGHYVSTAQPAYLYQVVFSSWLTKCSVALLLTLLCLQPVVPTVAAAEESETAETTEVVNIVDTEVEEPAEEEPAAEPEPVEEEPVAEPEIEVVEVTDDEVNEETDETQVEVTEADADTATSSVDQVADEPAESTTETSTSSATTTDPVGDVATDTSTSSATSTDATNDDSSAGSDSEETSEGETETEAEDEGADGNSDADPPAESDDNNSDSDADENTVDELSTTTVATPAATSTDLPVQTVSATASQVFIPDSDSDRHQFSGDECISVGQSAFYCQKDSGRTAVAVNDAVFAAPDKDGDKEIYLRTETGVMALTDNLIEDDAPMYSAADDVVVWHRLVEGRYQIMLYDLDSGEETQLTDNRVNDMEPTHADGVTTWQRWYEDNWEVVYLEDDELVRVTVNEVHDVAPNVEGGYIIWHTAEREGEKRIGVYELATGVTSFIDDGTDGEVTNPRFVLVYDTRFENGDVVTKGYDPQTGSVVPLSAHPGELPQELPDNDATGETRALLQNKPNAGREESDDDLEPTPNPLLTDDTASTTDETARSTEPLLDLREDVATTTPLELSEFDVVITPLHGSTSAQVGNSASTTDTVE